MADPRCVNGRSFTHAMKQRRAERVRTSSRRFFTPA
jgi:hypothetical protein